MDNKHAPGPWDLSDETTRDELPSRIIYGRPPHGLLAIVRTGSQGGYFGPGNAYMMCAAVDMFDALEADQKARDLANAVDLLVENEWDEDSPTGGEVIAKAYSDALNAREEADALMRAALAKAKGK